MKISTKGRYALRLMLDLAANMNIRRLKKFPCGRIYPINIWNRLSAV